MRPYKLPDGAVVWAGVLDESGGESPELGPLWEVKVEGAHPEEAAGHPLNSLLADVLGWHVAHEDWPAWIDELAAAIESDWRPSGDIP
jgi:hypothetical protein